MPTEFHYRGIHYRLVSQSEPILMVNGSPYENTFECWRDLCEALRDAYYLNLVPVNAFVDNRSEPAITHLVEPEDAFTYVENDDELDYAVPGMPDLPALTLKRPTIPQPIHLEIWAEKTTMNDVLLPLAQQYGLNLVTGAGEISTTRVREFVDRVVKSERPTRVLYVSDFDPAGRDMPISVAVKIQFELYRRDVDLDIQVRPVVLTPEQCIEYDLPRTPIKDGEKRGTAFEERFGEGATELDALEALHPGLLRQLLIKEIERYWDHDHDDTVARTCDGIDEQLDRITSEIHAEHQAEVNVLSSEWQRIANEHKAWVELATPVWQSIQEKCDENEPRIDEVEWVEPFEADEDPDPLFDSTRDYVTQVDRFKSHQGKPTASTALRHAVCAGCGSAFEATRKDQFACGEACRRKAQRDRKRPAAPKRQAVCPVCGAAFEARRKDQFLCGSYACTRANARRNEGSYREKGRPKTETLHAHVLPREGLDQASNGGDEP
jgi:hypothetical protein